MKALKGIRTFGTIGMVLLVLGIIFVLSWFGFAGKLGLMSIITLALTSIFGSAVVALATKKKEGLFAYVNIFLTVLLVSMLVGGAVTWVVNLV